MSKPKYRVAGERQGQRNWYSESTYSIRQVSAVLRAARDSARSGDSFWIERSTRFGWERFRT